MVCLGLLRLYWAYFCCVALIADVAMERPTVDEGVCWSDAGWMLRGLREGLLRFGDALREFVQGGGRGRRMGEGNSWKAVSE